MAKDLGEILDKICSDNLCNLKSSEETKYYPEMLSKHHKDDGLR